MKPTAFVLIDGSNFYHSVKEDIGRPLNETEFAQLFSQIEERFHVIEIRFYDALKDRIKEPENYAKQQRFHESLKRTRNLSIRTRTLKYIANMTPERVAAAAKQAGIVDKCKDLLWQLLVNLKLIRLTKEKGIDVLLVVQAIETARNNKPDWIILVSGDADFAPAIDLIRSLKVKTLNLHVFPGSSNELRNACDKHALINFANSEPEINWYD